MCIARIKAFERRVIVAKLWGQDVPKHSSIEILSHCMMVEEFVHL